MNGGSIQKLVQSRDACYPAAGEQCREQDGAIKAFIGHSAMPVVRPLLQCDLLRCSARSTCPPSPEGQQGH